MARLPFGRFARSLIERAAGSLHRAATNLVEVTSEVNAYAGLLEEKTGELRARTRQRPLDRASQDIHSLSTASEALNPHRNPPAGDK